MFSFVKDDLDFAHKLDKASSPTEEYFKHIHCFNEILYFVQGDADYTVEAETRHLRSGDLVFIPSGKFHFATVNSQVAYERYVLKFPDSLIPEYALKKLCNANPFYSDSAKYEIIFNLFDQYFKEYSEEELYTIFICEVTKLIVMLCHEPARSVQKNNDFIDELISYVDANIRKPITVQSLTEEFHYSKSFISVEFKRRMKVPIMQYVRTKKAIAAHRMILGGAKKSDVASLFGFETYSTFYRTYTKLLKGLNIDGFDEF